MSSRDPFVEYIQTRRQFEFCGIQVEELILKTIDSNVERLVWCLVPFELTFVGGYPSLPNKNEKGEIQNFLVHKEYSKQSRDAFELAQRMVRRAFENHYFRATVG